MVWLDLLDFVRRGSSDSFPNHQCRRDQRRLVSRTQQLDRDERLQSWLLSGELLRWRVVGMVHLLGDVRGRHADTHTHAGTGVVRRIVRRLANNANASVQHALLPAELPNLELVSVGHVFGDVRWRHSDA